MEKCEKYVRASATVQVNFAVSAQGAIIDNCTYCPYRCKGGGYCYLYGRSMADDAKSRPFFCGLKFDDEEWID